MGTGTKSFTSAIAATVLTVGIGVMASSSPTLTPPAFAAPQAVVTSSSSAGPTGAAPSLLASLSIDTSAKKQARQQRIKERREARAEKKRQAKIAARKERARKEAARLARIEKRTVETDGILGALTFLDSKPLENSLLSAVANIPARTSQAGWTRSMNMLTSTQPDFIFLNEVASRSTEEIQSLAPAFGVARGEYDPSPGGSQSRNNAILYRSDDWTPLASGMVRVVNDDRPIFKGKRVLWDRYAVWVMLRGTNGELISLISSHMPTNPGKYPQKWGGPSRISLYSRGMDNIKAMEAQLSQFGPVLIAGDMNSHPNQGSWTAPAKMSEAGYSYTKDSGVMYLFHKAQVLDTTQIKIDSDHPALVTRLTFSDQ